MRLIDANAMMKRLEEWNTNDSMDKALYKFTLCRIIEQPTIEGRKTGEWEYNMSYCGSIKFIHRKCSECGYESMGMGSKYCPDCGARMVNANGEGERKEE